jgi:6-pyruvoyltetrahydropterin/6-carboxytetrahydropterin synthase
MRIQLTRTVSFSAALRLPTSPHEKGRRLHGHNFRVELLVAGPVDAEHGWLVDFGDIRAAFAPLAERLDHSYLNEIEGLETPTLEAIEQWIFDRLKPRLPMLERVIVRVLGEGRFTPRRLAPDPRLDLPERLAFTLESAHHLPRAPEGHKCRRLHGHSLRIEAGAGDLDRLAAALPRIHERLDHRCLNEIKGLENPTSENLAVWIWGALRADAPDLTVVVVRESPESACFYRGEEAPNAEGGVRNAPKAECGMRNAESENEQVG